MNQSGFRHEYSISTATAYDFKAQYKRKVLSKS